MAIMAVRHPPPRESFSSCVSRELRNGMWRFPSTSALMQDDSASSDLLMCAPSAERAVRASVASALNG